MRPETWIGCGLILTTIKINWNPLSKSFQPGEWTFPYITISFACSDSLFGSSQESRFLIGRTSTWMHVNHVAWKMIAVDSSSGRRSYTATIYTLFPQHEPLFQPNRWDQQHECSPLLQKLSVSGVEKLMTISRRMDPSTRIEFRRASALLVVFHFRVRFSGIGSSLESREYISEFSGIEVYIAL